MVNRRSRRLAVILAGAGLPAAFAVAAEEATDLGQMVITAPPMSDPITVETDPRAPRQPVPAADGAAYLDNIPGFASARKGGTSGDPVFRGLGGSRLNILQNDTYVFGGCGGRMDPPTAYIYPESFEQVTVVKGPQTVLHGGGNLAATVLFERRTERFEQPGTRFFGSALAGSHDRNDQLADFTAGNADGFLRAIGTRSAAGNYEDGDGTEIHSEYTRWSGTAIAGWTPDDDTRLELTVERSDGEAAYADRTMDGTAFDRTGYSARYETALPGGFDRLTAQYYHSYVDHVMDNFTLREPPVMMGNPMKMVSNPDRETQGARAAVDLTLGAATFATAGVDHRTDAHTKRTASSSDGSAPVLGPRIDDMSFTTTGVFAEVEHQAGARDTWVGGLRFDRTKATAESAVGGAAAGDDDEDTTRGAFVRLEHSLSPATVVFAGVGQAERSPDYWERATDFDLGPELLSQLDLGLSHRAASFDANVSAFYGQIDDYILIDWNTPKSARNVDVSTYGVEADAAYRLAPSWKATATLAHIWGNNDTDDRPLPQVPPLEGTLALDYDNGTYTAGVLMRAVAAQDRVDVGSGSIVGQDLDESDAFTVVSLHGGYRAGKQVELTAGVDNLFDETYAEHISRAGAAVPDFEQTEQVNEPGRTYWLKATARF